jgi:hypothetical protein
VASSSLISESANYKSLTLLVTWTWLAIARVAIVHSIQLAQVLLSGLVEVVAFAS